MIYMMQQIAPGPYKTAHYTFATALMGACMMLTGAVSGFIQKAVGYQWFFIIVLIAAVPSLLATIFAPFHHPDITEAARQGVALRAFGQDQVSSPSARFLPGGYTQSTETRDEQKREFPYTKRVNRVLGLSTSAFTLLFAVWLMLGVLASRSGRSFT